jgi:hypothetical protein
MLQPRLLAAVVLLAIVLQSAAMFLILAGILWWNVLVPRRNPFDALYNQVIAAPRNLPPLTPADAPRRRRACVTGRKAGPCLDRRGSSCSRPGRSRAWPLLPGSYLYHLLRGETSFANRTLPWSRAE